MSTVLHLLRHDLKVHGLLLAIWTAVIVCHPLSTLLPWGRWPGSLVFIPAALLVMARVILGVVVIGSIVQQDSPVDDRAFWRTRPIPANQMAATKLLMAAALFVLLPLLVVLATALAAAVPWSHWPATIFQVLFVDAALVGLTMAVATRTRRLSTLLIAVVGCLLLGYLLLISAYELRRMAAVAHWVKAGAFDPELAFPTMWMWAAVGLWCVTAIGYSGYRRRNAFALATGATAVAMLVTWLVPQARVHARSVVAPDATVITVPADSVRAQRIPGRDSLIGITAQPLLRNGQPGDRMQAYLLAGRISGAGIAKPARVDGDPRAVTLGNMDDPYTPLLAVVRADEFAELAGKPVRFAGQLNVEVSRSTLVASAPMAPGTRLRVGSSQVTVTGLLPLSSDIPQPVATGTLVEMYVPGWAAIRGREFRLRDPEAGCSAPLYPRSGMGAQLAFISLLPTFARPFTVQRGTLVAIARNGCRPVPARSVLEAHELRTLGGSQGVEVDFTVPTVIDPEPPVRIAR